MASRGEGWGGVASRGEGWDYSYAWGGDGENATKIKESPLGKNEFPWMLWITPLHELDCLHTCVGWWFFRGGGLFVTWECGLYCFIVIGEVMCCTH